MTLRQILWFFGITTVALMVLIHRAQINACESIADQVNGSWTYSLMKGCEVSGIATHRPPRAR